MKKIIIASTVLLLFAGSAGAQQTMLGSAKVMTVEEASKANGGIPKTTINGKPYSQYKAEQDALKQKQNNETAQAIARRNGKSDGAQSEKTVLPQRNLNVQGSSVEPEVKAEAALVKTEEPKPAAKTAAPSPFSGGVASKPAPVVEQQVSLKGTSMDSDAKPVPAAAKPARRTGGGDTPVEKSVVKEPVVTTAASSSQAKAPVPPPVETAKPASATTNNQ